jgi:hypothetical protein
VCVCVCVREGRWCLQTCGTKLSSTVAHSLLSSHSFFSFPFFFPSSFLFSISLIVEQPSHLSGPVDSTSVGNRDLHVKRHDASSLSRGRNPPHGLTAHPAFPLCSLRRYRSRPLFPGVDSGEETVLSKRPIRDDAVGRHRNRTLFF